MKAHQKIWDKEELAFLRRNYSGMPLELISDELGRTVNTIKTRAHMIGLVRWNPWTDKQLMLLKQLYPTATPWPKIIQKIGRTEDAIRAAARKYGLKRPANKGTLLYASGRKKYKVMPNGCWLWMASRDDRGYATVSVAGKNKKAHRQTFEDAHGKTIPKGLEIDHLCRNTSCVNPDHLEAVTHRVNIQRAKMKP